MEKDLDDDEVCIYCQGDGVVPCDKLDPDSGRWMNGVGEQKCICQIEE